MICPLRYDSGLNLQQAETRFKEAEKEFKRVKNHYSGLIGRFRKNISKEDQESLLSCVGVLLPLGLEASVQEQVKQTENPENAVFYKASQLNAQIMLYLSNFKNTRIEQIRGIHL